jgi:hypothetical protein
VYAAVTMRLKASRKSPRTRQHMQPFGSSTTSGARCAPGWNNSDDAAAAAAGAANDDDDDDEDDDGEEEDDELPPGLQSALALLDCDSSVTAAAAAASSAAAANDDESISWSSTDTAPTSFSMTARRRRVARSRRLRSVVLPLPRKPVRITVGTRRRRNRSHSSASRFSALVMAGGRGCLGPACTLMPTPMPKSPAAPAASMAAARERCAFHSALPGSAEILLVPPGRTLDDGEDDDSASCEYPSSRPGRKLE